MAIKDSIGEKIRIQRMIKGYSQEYMSWVMDMSQAAYSNLEREETRMTIRRLYEIAEILEISPFELMPKPKFGLAINMTSFWRTIRKFKTVWIENINQRKRNAPPI